jgi:hypothetical protein
MWSDVRMGMGERKKKERKKGNKEQVEKNEP